MHKVTVSEKKLAANRANALKSTGPRTAAGKQRSALNGCKHHLYARSHPLPPDWLEYAHHYAAVIARDFSSKLRPLVYLRALLRVRHQYCTRLVSIFWEQYRQAPNPLAFLKENQATITALDQYHARLCRETTACRKALRNAFSVSRSQTLARAASASASTVNQTQIQFSPDPGITRSRAASEEPPPSYPPDSINLGPSTTNLHPKDSLSLESRFFADIIQPTGVHMPSLSSALCRLPLLAALVVFPCLAQDSDPPQNSGQNCSFIAAPDEFAGRESRARRDAYERTLAFTRATAKTRAAATTVLPAQIPVRNFIDEEILHRLEAEGVQSAQLSSDEEFLRRVTLDLTGRIPSAADLRAFKDSDDPNKRDAVIDKLLFSPEFTDKWTLWLGEILQNAATAQNRSQQIEGRNRLHEWIRASIDSGKSWRDIAWEMIAATGNNYDRATPGANFILRGFAPMGPVQDTYDLLLVKTATAFLGISHYDCLLCHNGRFHTDQISVWATRSTRLEAQRMAAHFSRVQITTYRAASPTDYYVNSTEINDRPNGTYDLNTNFGNRPNRTPLVIDGRNTTNLTPLYRDGTAATGNWREALAKNLTRDRMFARNYANRVWKAMFNLALAEPVDGLDPARLDPSVEPPPGWDYQASHPVLLEKLAQVAIDNDFNLRETLRFIASSSAYQLSSRYEGDWDLTKATLFARHIPRRLEAEEVHDAIVKATALVTPYTVGGWTDPVNWAMQLPEPTEPRSNGTANAFMNSFSRGNRDTLQRSQAGSILMWLNMMNSTLVTNRTRATGATASPFLAGLMAAGRTNDSIVDDLFLTFLSRSPSDYERGVALKTLSRATSNATRATAIEDLAWALINKTDFLFSY